ncbi:LacI family DNA-binding transcriptional regulator, partial [Trebonia sp.]
MGNRAACTLYDVARAAAVSTATVSRVVHGNDRVRPATRQRVLEVIDELGYVPDAAAQSMAWHRKEVIGLVTITARGPETDVEREGVAFIEEVLRGVQVALSKVGWSVLISVLAAAERSDAYQQLRRISAKVDGLVIAEGIISSEQLALLAERVPIVLAAGSLDEPNADVVDADNWSGTTELLRHMLEQHG